MGFTPPGVTKLSELEIDTSKDWNGYLIKGLGAAVDDDDLLTRVQALLQSIFTEQGDILYRNDTEGVKLDAGTSGRFLELVATSKDWEGYLIKNIGAGVDDADALKKAQAILESINN